MRNGIFDESIVERTGGPAEGPKVGAILTCSQYGEAEKKFIVPRKVR
jgi:hypothetical protein